MAQALISVVRQRQGRNLHPRRGRTKRSYPTQFKQEICRVADEFNLKCGGKLQAKVEEKLHCRLSLSTLHDILK